MKIEYRQVKRNQKKDEQINVHLSLNETRMVIKRRTQRELI